jgi:signal transduction histidine kinase
MLSATSLDLIAPHDIATLLETIVERVTDLVSGTDGYVYLSEDTEGELRCVAEHHSAQESAPNPAANGERPMGTVVATDKAIATKHGHRGWLPTLEGGAEQGDRTSVVAPLISMDRAIGAIRVSRDADNPFSEDDAELLNHFANHAALAIGYHRLLESEREQRQFTETLREVASVLNNTLNRESVLQHILGQLGRVIDFSSASVMLISDGKLDLVAHRGARAGNQPFTPMPIEAFSHIQEAIDTRRPVTIPDTAVDPRWQDRASSVFIRSWLGVPLVVQDRVIGLLNIGKEEPQFYGEEEGQVAAAFADHAAIAIENARLYTETEQQAVDLETNLELARIASSTLELEEVLVLISEHMVRALQVHGCTVSRWDPETGTAISWLERNDRPPAAGEPREVYTVGDLDMICTLGERRQPVTVQIGDLDPESTWVQRWKARGTISGLILPLVAGNSVIGFIELEANGPRCFGRRELDLAEALAAGAAVAIQNAQLYEDVRVGRERLQSLSQQLVEVQEAERRHIARELHDEVSQVLTALKLMLETSRRLPTEGARVKLEQADNLITELIRQVREMSLDLRPPMLDDAGLLPTLLWYFKRYTAHTEVEVRFHHEGLDQPLPEAVATAAYRIVQEALTNVARHADVDEVAVEVRADGNVLTLRVEDRGIGFDYHGVRAKRSTGGLQGFYERAALLGGRATVISAPGAGAVLSAELPIAPPGLAEEHRDA